MKIKTLSIMLLLLGCSVLFAKAPDYRVKNRLDARDFKYKITENGNFRMIIKLSNNRTQLVFVQSNTSKLGNMEIREVWSVGYKGQLNASVMRNMLRRSEKLKLGAWGINSDEDRGIFTAKIPAQLPAEDLVKTIFTVAEAADELEQDVHGSDDL